MELAAHWHRFQNLQKTSGYFQRKYSDGEIILSSVLSHPAAGQARGPHPSPHRPLPLHLRPTIIDPVGMLFWGRCDVAGPVGARGGEMGGWGLALALTITHKSKHDSVKQPEKGTTMAEHCLPSAVESSLP